MSLLNVFYDGRKKAVKVNPSTFLQTVLNEACEYFNVDVSCCYLQHKRARVDTAVQFRLSGISNNATLDLIFDPNIKNLSAKCKLAFSIDCEVQGSHSSTEVFLNSSSLFDLISFCLKNLYIADYTLQSVKYEVVILGKLFQTDSFNIFEFQNVKLSDMGLQSSYRVNIRCKLCNDNKLSSPSSHSTSVTSPTVSSKISVAEAVISNESLEVVESNTASTYSSSGMEASVPLPELSSSNTVEENPADTTEYKPKSLRVVLTNMVNSNFTASAIKALTLIAKYIYNILLHPTRVKYRIVRLSNSVFQENVWSVTGALEVLFSLNFVPYKQIIADKTQFSRIAYDEVMQCVPCAFSSTRFTIPQDIFLIAGVGMDVFELNDESVDIIQYTAYYEYLLLCSEQLGCRHLIEDTPVPVEDTPVPVEDTPVSAVSKPAPQPIFDVFSSSLFKANESNGFVPMKVSKSSVYQSETERKLALLKNFETEYANTADQYVERCTQLVIMNNGEIKANISGNDDNVEPGDGKLLMQRYAKRNKTSVFTDSDGNPVQSSDATLTTQSMRDLEKALNSLLYTKTLIRIKLPITDKICLICGYFSVKESLNDVYNWISSLLSSSTTAEVPIFSLFSPVLYGKQTVSLNGASLQDLGLIPSAQFHLAWKEGVTFNVECPLEHWKLQEFHSVFDNTLCEASIDRHCSGIRTHADAVLSIPKGLYLKEVFQSEEINALMSKSNDKEIINELIRNSRTVKSKPSSATVVPNESVAKPSNSSSKTEDSSNSSTGKDSKSGSGKAKPAWLKI